MDKHVQVIGILWIILGGLSFLGGLASFGIFFGISFIPDIGPEATSVLRIVGTSIGLFLWVISAPAVICGVGLIKRVEWARILALILSFLNLINIPFGTALAVYTLVILFKEETIKEFNPKG